MSNNPKDFPFDDWDKGYPPKSPFKNPWIPHRPRDSLRSFDTMLEEFEKLLKEVLNDLGFQEKMTSLDKETVLNAKVRKGERLYKITIENITPEVEEDEESIEIEWDTEGGFGDGHEDLKE